MEQSLFDFDKINLIKTRLAEAKETIAVAESVTTGLLQFAVASADDARIFFQGGITTYNLGQKSRHLLVDPIHAEACDCVSEKIAEQMCIQVTELFRSDWGVSITGYASPAPESDGQLFAIFCISKKGAVIRTGTIRPQTSGFPNVQLEYVNQVVEELAKAIEQ